MLQVQVFDEEHEDDLSEDINGFLLAHDAIDVFDIKFSTAMMMIEEEQVYGFSAMIIYRDKVSD